MTNSQLDTTNESQEVSPFPAGDNKAHINRRAQRHTKHKTEQKHPQKKYRLGMVSKIFYWRAILFDLHSGKKSESNPHILKDDFRKMQFVIRITNKFILMSQRKTQRLAVLLYQTTIVICNVYLSIHQFSLLTPKQLI